MRALRDALTLRSGVTLLLRLVLCGILLYAAVGKWPAPRAFAEDVANYRLLPAALVPLATAGLLGVEVVLGLMLLLGVLLPEAALLTALKSVVGSFTAHHAIVIGALFVVSVIFFPKGLIGYLAPALERRWSRR